MAKTSQRVQVGKRKFELTNLSKVLWPEDGFVKAELIEYYLRLAPTILAHVKGRPLTLVRFPDGIHEETFYQKNRPKWAPEWIESIKIGDEKKVEYMLATEEASLVWLANLACIEMHQMHSRAPDYNLPDYVVFDLDPPDDYPFVDVVALGLKLREHIEGYGYHPFVKTTGRKGLHIVLPIERRWTFDQAFAAAKDIATPFVKANGNVATLNIKKESRKGRVLVDIYRNRNSQSIVSAYSVRGLPGATVSAPVTWEALAELDTLKGLNIHTVPDRVLADGDPWEGIDAYAVALHTDRPKRTSRRKLGPNEKHKTPEQLASYEKKRTFDKTPEPTGGAELGTGNAFVVHRHHASRLHYDLRLEQDGVLKSWAVPRGMPQRPGIKRLAVQTEDHPIEYLNFEGEIPKGEYGGGDMWVYARGRYEITKEKKKGFYFRLQSKELSAEFRMHETSNKQWMLERVDNPQIDYLADHIEPMLATLEKEVPADDHIYEVKWDGIRALIAFDDGQLTIRSRNLRDITANFPELVIPETAFRGSCGLLDTEIVVLEPDGRPNFRKVINRLQQRTEGGVKRSQAKYPAVCYAFDLLYLDGRPLVNDALERRREYLQDLIKPGTPYRVSEAIDDGAGLFAAAEQLGVEGIMAKKRGSTYTPGRRSAAWLKIKTRQTAECVILGYTRGKGNREGTFGALHLGQDDGGLRYVGKVGTGFDDKALEDVLTALESIKEAKRPVDEKPVDDANSVWLEPKLHCEVEYGSLTSNKTLREPVFVRLRPDLATED